MLLLDNRFLGAVLRAFENRPEPTRRFGKPARAHLAGFQKLFANSKAFRAKRQRISSFNIKLKGQLKNFSISSGRSLNQDPSDLFRTVEADGPQCRRYQALSY